MAVLAPDEVDRRDQEHTYNAGNKKYKTKTFKKEIYIYIYITKNNPVIRCSSIICRAGVVLLWQLYHLLKHIFLGKWIEPFGNIDKQRVSHIDSERKTPAVKKNAYAQLRSARAVSNQRVKSYRLSLGRPCVSCV